MGSVLKKVMFVGKATTFMVGLAMILALTVGVAGAAFGANGANFLLGKSNTANVITQLVGSVAGPGLQIDNNSTDAAATALDLQVEAGKAPMKVRKRKRAKDEAKSAKKTKLEAREEEAKMTENEKTAKRNQIIGRKRQMRRNRK